jgi:hypothetical protein
MKQFTYSHPENWIQAMTVVGNWRDDALAIATARAISRWSPIPATFSGSVLSPYETRLLRAAASAAQQVRTELGAAPRAIDWRRCSFLEAQLLQAEFARFGGNKFCDGGTTSDGFVYLKRGPYVQMAKAVSHEFGHLHSFQARTLDYNLLHKPKLCRTKGLEPFCTVQMGLHTVIKNQPDGAPDVHRGWALDEAAADLFSERVREKLLPSGLIKIDETCEFINTYTYVRSIELVKAIGGFAFGDVRTAVNALLADSLNGTDVFMKTVGRRYDPEPILRMTPDYASVMATAKAIGLKAVVN